MLVPSRCVNGHRCAHYYRVSLPVDQDDAEVVHTTAIYLGREAQAALDLQRLQKQLQQHHTDLNATQARAEAQRQLQAQKGSKKEVEKVEKALAVAGQQTDDTVETGNGFAEARDDAAKLLRTAEHTLSVAQSHVQQALQSVKRGEKASGRMHAEGAEIEAHIVDKLLDLVAKRAARDTSSDGTLQVLVD